MKHFNASWIGIGLIFLLSIPAFPATVTLVPINPFGRPLGGCGVSSFRTIDTAEGQRDYRFQFVNLVGRDIPAGAYNVSIRCSDAEAHGRLTVDHERELQVVSSRNDILAHDHASPELVVRMDSPVQNAETWWIRLIGAYNGQNYVGQFNSINATATLERPRSGRYIVLVASTGGYSCLREVDLATFTKLWIFQRSGCSLQFDNFARVVGDEDRDPSRPGRIESAIQNQWADILRSLPEQ